MKSKLKLIAVIALVGLLAAAAAGGAVWWAMNARATQAEQPESAAQADDGKPAPDYKYVTLEKVLVMMRGSEGDSVPHYLAMDVVFKTLPEQEKRAKEHLPLLRTVAVKALSAYTLEGARAMTVPQFADVLNKAYHDSYAAERREAPFAEALIGKLIIE
ncbi:flagellar basal body protein [Roseateles sp.]|uniref:flagellar basal body protein n=1 Tax=Roseateles sp. TaxID=1971397 RepID=UPI0025D5B4E0|nr:flagellar basal body protein [Roseateles sp.]MBV8036776.1 flagellar basal body protein [Roseateles sp.]